MSKAERRMRRAAERTRAGKRARIAAEVERRKALIRESIQADADHLQDWGAMRESMIEAMSCRK